MKGLAFPALELSSGATREALYAGLCSAILLPQSSFYCRGIKILVGVYHCLSH